MYGAIVLPAETMYDALSAVVAQLIFIIPFFFGRQFFRNSTDNEEILRALVIAGLIYSLPMLFEIRMSPQLQTWIYGYFPGAFDQQVRYDGYRPVVFLGHGLGLAFFAMTTTVAAAAFWRTGTRILQLPAGGITAYLSAMLILCKSLGSLVYAAALIPMVRFAKPRLQMRAAAVLAAIAFCYPLLRTADIFPTETILNAAQFVSEDRAASLKTRFDQEQQLLEHALRRPVFGWGQFWKKSNLRRGTRQRHQHHRRVLGHHHRSVWPGGLRGPIWIAGIDGVSSRVRSQICSVRARPGLFGGPGAPRGDQYD